MRILCWGSDPRYTILTKELSKKYDVDMFNDLNLDIKKYDIIILPMRGVNDNDFIELLKKSKQSVVIYTGLVGNLKNINREVISFLDDKEIRNQNDEITVDGIMDYIKKVKHDRVCILGFGHIGKRLYERLSSNCDVSVGIILESDKEVLKQRAFYTTDDKRMINVFNNSDLIINTVPINIINSKVASNLSTPIIDVASSPHGIDKKLVEENNLDYNLYLGIPGKYDPERAGKVLLKKFI